MLFSPWPCRNPDEHTHEETEHTAALEEELLLVAGVEAGLPSAIAQACASVSDARAATEFYSPDSSTIATEPPTLQPAAILARVRGVCPGATAQSEWCVLSIPLIANKTADSPASNIDIVLDFGTDCSTSTSMRVMPR